MLHALRNVALLGLLALPTGALAAPGAPANSQELVSEVKKAYTGTTSVRAEFTQVVRSKATGKEDRQKGKIALERPRKVRVELGGANGQLFVSDGASLWVYSARDKYATQMPDMGQGSSVGILLDDLARIDEVFAVALVPSKSDRVVTARLTPRQPGAFTTLELTFTKKKFELDRLVLTSATGDVTEMTFSGVRMNQDVPDADFRFTPPAGVTVSKAAP